MLEETTRVVRVEDVFYDVKISYKNDDYVRVYGNDERTECVTLVSITIYRVSFATASTHGAAFANLLFSLSRSLFWIINK